MPSPPLRSASPPGPPRTGYPYLDAVLDPPGGVLAFAHRGGPGHPDLTGLENTLHAFRQAVSLGYQYLETDVHVTRDGILLAVHDTVLDRVADLRGAIAELTYAQVQTALIGGREPVPTLSQLFDELPDGRFNIDLKSRGAVPALARFLRERDAWDRVLVVSFSPRRLQDFRRLTDGRIPTAAHPGEIAAFWLLPGRWADRVTRGRVAALQVPHRRGPLVVASAGLVRRAHAAGKHVHVWTVDDPAEIHRLLDRGVDGLMTDRTDVLRRVLLARGQWRTA